MMHGLQIGRSGKPAWQAPFVCEPIEKGRREDLDEIDRLVAKLEPKLAAAIYAALLAQQDAVTISKLVAALKTGIPANVMAVLDEMLSPGFLAGIEAALVSATTAAGVATAAQIARITRVDFSFGVINPRLVSWLQTYSLSLIKQVSDATRENIRMALVAGMQSGQSPVATARDIKQVTGLTVKQGQAVLNYRKQLETFHQRRSAAGWNLGGKIDRRNGRQVFRPDKDGSPLDGIDERRLRDFRFDGHLKRALESGKPIDPKTIDKMVAAYARKYLKYRSETIAVTEAERAANAGVQDAWRQAIEAGKVPEALVRRQWVVGRDERQCSICAAVPNMNPKRGVKFGEPFATPIGPKLLPGLHPRCRCKVFIRAYEPSQLSRSP